MGSHQFSQVRIVCTSAYWGHQCMIKHYGNKNFAHLVLFLYKNAPRAAPSSPAALEVYKHKHFC